MIQLDCSLVNENLIIRSAEIFPEIRELKKFWINSEVNDSEVI